MQFQNTLDFMSQMKDTSSVLDKVALLEATDDVTRQVLFWAYNTYKQFHIGVDNLKKRKDLTADTCDYEDLFDLLAALDAREITGHEALAQTNAFIRDNPAIEEMERPAQRRTVAIKPLDAHMDEADLRFVLLQPREGLLRHAKVGAQLGAERLKRRFYLLPRDRVELPPCRKSKRDRLGAVELCAGIRDLRELLLPVRAHSRSELLQ